MRVGALTVRLNAINAPPPQPLDSRRREASPIAANDRRIELTVSSNPAQRETVHCASRQGRRGGERDISRVLHASFQSLLAYPVEGCGWDRRRGTILLFLPFFKAEKSTREMVEMSFFFEDVGKEIYSKYDYENSRNMSFVVFRYLIVFVTSRNVLFSFVSKLLPSPKR